MCKADACAAYPDATFADTSAPFKNAVLVLIPCERTDGRRNFITMMKIPKPIADRIRISKILGLISKQVRLRDTGGVSPVLPPSSRTVTVRTGLQL